MKNKGKIAIVTLVAILLGSVVIGYFNFGVFPMEAPVPPAGSDYDQSTIGASLNQAYRICGHEYYSGNAACSFAQEIINDRTPITGYGGYFRRVGSLTEPLVIGLKANLNDEAWITSKTIYPDEFPDSSRFIYDVFPDQPIDYPIGTKIYMVAMSTQPLITANEAYAWHGNSVTSGSTAYPRGIIYWSDGSGWEPWTNFDTIFFTFTETPSSGTTPPDTPLFGLYVFPWWIWFLAAICVIIGGVLYLLSRRKK